jgi:hypothetical protein
MRRTAIVILAVILLLGLSGLSWAAPGGVPGPPSDSSTTTTIPAIDRCVFDDTGVLEGWSGTPDDLFICDWVVDHLPQSVYFQMEALGGGIFRNAYIGVKDAFEPAGDFCFVERLGQRGSYTEFTFGPVGLPSDGVCGDRWDDGRGPLHFALMVEVGKLRRNDVDAGVRLCLGTCPSQ